jgi:hypothetical protein
MKNGGQMNTDGRGTCRGCPLWHCRLFPASRPSGLATRAKSALSHPYRFSPYNTVVHPPLMLDVGIVLGVDGYRTRSYLIAVLV